MVLWSGSEEIMSLRWIAAAAVFFVSSNAQPQAPAPARPLAVTTALEPFKGITASGEPEPGLFQIKSTGVSTEPIRTAAEKFIAGLTEKQREITLFPLKSHEWRRWDNRHSPPREGVRFKEMTDAQRALAFELFRASLSAKGLKQTRDIMRLNETIAEMTQRFNEYGEWLYHITIMGKPSATEPWGWQLDGHHLVINYFVMGDQVVMSPNFMGSEPVRAETGKYQGTVVLQEEQDKGLAFMRSLAPEQQKKARLGGEKGPSNNLTEAYRDNVVLDYAGLPAKELPAERKEQLLELIQEYVGRMRDGHARVKMSEVRQQLDRTWFGWIGATEADSVFYYRIHSPVILIEFDHQRPIALGRSDTPTRNHIHTVVRTPNGNDYGADLLRQHYEQHSHDHDH
jgi:hypothetical protein